MDSGKLKSQNISFLNAVSNNIRHDMLTATSRFCNPGLDVLLYGNFNLPNETTILIYTTIQTSY